jgi:hypothetical protein
MEMEQSIAIHFLDMKLINKSPPARARLPWLKIKKEELCRNLLNNTV